MGVAVDNSQMSDGEDSAPEDYSSWTVVELRATLKQLGADTKGTKAVLVERLASLPPSDSQQQSDEESESKPKPLPSKRTRKPSKKFSSSESEGSDEEPVKSTRSARAARKKKVEDSESEEDFLTQEDSDEDASAESEPEEDSEEEFTTSKSKSKKRKSTPKKSTARAPAKKKKKSDLVRTGHNLSCSDSLPQFSTGDFDSKDEFPKFMISKASSGRSSCKYCKESIADSSIRVGVQWEEFEETDHGNVGAPQWFHPECFGNKKPRKLTKPTQVINYSLCGPELKAIIKQWFSGKPSETRTKAREAKEKYLELAKSLGNLTAPKLKDILRTNSQKITGNKDELLLRIGEGMANGALPKCPKCGGGYLNLSEDFETAACKGFMDDDTFVRCSYSIAASEVKRDPWQSVEEASQ